MQSKHSTTQCRAIMCPVKKQPEKTARTKRDFIDAFWQLYAQTPVDRITVASICQRAGYHRGTFYLHFHDVYQLLEEEEATLLEDMRACVENCMKRVSGNPGKLAKIAALKDVVVFYEGNKRAITTLLGPQGDPSFTPRLKNALKPLWRHYVVGECPGRSEQEIDLILEYTLAGGIFMISRWLEDPGTMSAYEIGHLVYDTAFRQIPL